MSDLVLSRSEIAALARDTTPRWWGLWHRAYARVVETDKQTAAEQAAALEQEVA